MRNLAHLLSVFLLLPNLVFASAFVIFGHTLAAATSFVDFLVRLFMDAAWVAPLACLALFVVLLVLVFLGLSDRRRWIAGLSIAILSIASTLVLLVMSGVPDSTDGWSFFLPGFLALAIGAWLALDNGRKALPATP
jgi:hypothetical protein